MARIAIEINDVTTISDLIRFVELTDLLGFEENHRITVRTSLPPVIRAEAHINLIHLPGDELDDAQKD